MLREAMVFLGLAMQAEGAVFAFMAAIMLIVNFADWMLEAWTDDI